MKAWKHFKTITRHKIQVMKGCFKVGLYKQGLMHDLSKYSPSEFWVGVKYYQGNRSPNNAEREAIGYSSAWLHHKGRNKHHYEYWIDHNPKTDSYEAYKMPIKYVKESFCDRVAATKIYMKKNYTNQGVMDYYIRHRDHYIIHPETAVLLESWITLLIEKGEKETFKHIRKVKNY